MYIGIKQRLLKWEITLSILLTDVFNTYKWEVYSYNKVFYLTDIGNRKRRMLWIGISCNINSFKQKEVKSKKEEAEPD